MPHEIAAHIINRNVIGTLISLLLCQNPIEYRRPTRLIVVSIRTFVVGLWRRRQAARHRRVGGSLQDCRLLSS
jgi:hypothetical protein